MEEALALSEEPGQANTTEGSEPGCTWGSGVDPWHHRGHQGQKQGRESSTEGGHSGLSLAQNSMNRTGELAPVQVTLCAQGPASDTRHQGATTHGQARRWLGSASVLHTCSLGFEPWRGIGSYHDGRQVGVAGGTVVGRGRPTDLPEIMVSRGSPAAGLSPGPLWTQEKHITG